MSSPDHPTSNIEDAFSSNFPNYLPLASPDYIPTSPKQGRSSSSTSSLPQAFEIGESSRKTSIECHEEQIEEIVNYLGKLSLDRIVHIEDKVEGLGKGRCHCGSGSTSCNNGNLSILMVRKEQLALSAVLNEHNQYSLVSDVLKKTKKIEEEIYNLTVKGNDLKHYVRRFQELTILCPNMVPNTEKLLEAFIGGLPRSIEGNVTASRPQTL
ncbi:hypothetical protein Tco_0408926 [Tanacetum coccineum]